MTTEHCPICHSEKTKFLFEGYDFRCGCPDSSQVYACNECQQVFVAGVLMPEVLTNLYTNYYPRANFNVDDYQPYKEKNAFFHWLDGGDGLAYSHVPKNVRVLDIGCGFCETLGYHQNRGCEVYGVEADENARKIAEKYGFNVEIGLFDPQKYEENFFDYVTMDQVFEHLLDPLQTLKDVYTVLKPGGKFIAVCPNPQALGRYVFGQYWTCWHLPFHRHFYTKKSVSRLAEASGFTVETFKTATEAVNLLNNWSALFFARTRGKRSDAVSTNGRYFDAKLRKRFDVSLYLFLKKIRFLCFSMRIADLCGLGDYHLMVLKKNSNSVKLNK